MAFVAAARMSASGLLKASEIAIEAAKSDKAHDIYKAIGHLAEEAARTALWAAKHEVTRAALDVAKDAIISVIENAPED
ncbi:hypothetical protein GWK15_14960 [Roseomonas oryzicola]|uniref:Uncharacterized protein n=1 Tax=Neoroseomonas oryzicola TaxID=535904 RepID=A0A9X9WJH3_9PROT|nr:hypothetical protein [Neoroseomonas oryzicola]NKE18251.1 hypothetical protein [Neoroseomonas oryzicola]